MERRSSVTTRAELTSQVSRGLDDNVGVIGLAASSSTHISEGRDLLCHPVVDLASQS